MSDNESFKGMVLFGGIPTKTDIAPSIIFLLVYVIMSVGFVYRLLARQCRPRYLITPGIFSLVRVAAFAIRIIMGFNSKDGRASSRGLYIAELIHLCGGFVLIVQPSFKLATDEMIVPSIKHFPWCGRLIFLFRYLGIAPIVLLNVFSVDATSSNPDVSQNMRLREAAYYLLLSMSTIGTVGTVCILRRIDLNGALVCLWANLFCLVLSIYRLIEVYSTASDPINDPAVFYCVSCLFEVLVVLPYVAFDFRIIFSGDSDLDVEKLTEQEESQVKDDVYKQSR